MHIALYLMDKGLYAFLNVAEENKNLKFAASCKNLIFKKI